MLYYSCIHAGAGSYGIPANDPRRVHNADCPICIAYFIILTQNSKLIIPKGGGGHVANGNNKQRTVSLVTSSTGARGRGADAGTNLNQIAGDRPIFTLSVAADLLGLHPRTLRIYEEKGLVVPARTGGNRRRYSQNDITRFQT